MSVYCDTCERNVPKYKMDSGKHERGRKHGILAVEKQLKENFGDEAKDYMIVETDASDSRFQSSGKYTLKDLVSLFKKQPSAVS
jgi:hypothetical protein